MAIKVGTGITTKQVAVAGSTTQVKRVVVGVPIRGVSGSGFLGNLNDVTLTNLQNLQVLQYDSAQGVWVNGSALQATGVTSGTYGSATQIPQLSITSDGLIDSAKNISVATILSTLADSGTGSVSLLDSSLTITGGTGINTTVSGTSIIVNLDSSDPNPVGDSGDLIIRGNLRVDGITTTINSTTLTINDKNIILADSAPDAASADSAGIFIEGANASLYYTASNDRFNVNKGLNIKDSIGNGLFFEGTNILDAITFIDGGTF